jgi:hypothetical protein
VADRAIGPALGTIRMRSRVADADWDADADDRSAESW